MKMNHFFQIMRQVAVRLPQRTIATSARKSHEVVLDADARDRIHPRIGNRDIVGFGINGSASYFDVPEFPCPAIRFKENSPDVLTLREKEKADWKNLTLEEKKELYRISFCQTYSEMRAPTGQWKAVLALTLFGLTMSGWLCIWMKLYVYDELPHTMSEEWRQATVKKMILERQGAVQGISSKWDYENDRWKA